MTKLYESLKKLEVRRNQWKYKGPVETSKITRMFGVAFISNYRPGISIRPSGWSMLTNSRKMYCFCTDKAAFALFRSDGKWRFRKGTTIEGIFQKWGLERSPIKDQFEPNEPAHIYTKEEIQALEINSYDITKDPFFNAPLPKKITATDKSERYYYHKDPFSVDPSAS